MLRSRLLGLAVAALVLTLLAGCTGTGEDSAAPDASSGVEVSGEQDVAPEITVPDADPPTDLVVETLAEGDGDEVAAGDLLLADYAGVLWDTGEEFDSSWSRGEPAAFGIGVDAVIDGWDAGLVGQRVGSRVLLTIPPEQAYGDQDTGTIPPDSTLVFVVDIRDTFSASDAGQGTAVSDLPAGLPEVTGEAGTEPTVQVDGAEEPAQSTSVLVIDGQGEPIETDATIVVHAVQSDLRTGEVLFSTWAEGSAPEQLAAAALPGLSEALDGQRAGARVVSLIAEEDNEGQPLVLVLDVLGSF